VVTPQVPSPAQESPAAYQGPPFKPYSNIIADFGYKYAGLFGQQKSNHTTGQLASALSPEFEISWQQILNEKISTRLFFYGSDIHFESAKSGVSISHPTIYNRGMGIGFYNKVSKDWGINLEGDVGQRLFYQAHLGGGLEIDQVPILRTRAGLNYELFNTAPIEILFVGGLSYFGASFYDGYSISTGFGYDFGFKISQQFKQTRFSCKIGYSERDQNTAYLTFVEKGVGGMCGFSWGLSSQK
jgi:hypothetical protein